MKEINSIIKAAEILKCLTNGDSQLSHIAQKLGYNKATAFRILKTLDRVGFAAQDPATLHYHPGPLLHTLTANSLQNHRLLNSVSLRHLEELRDDIGESVNLQIPIGNMRIFIEVVHMVREYMFYNKPGDTAPIYSGAAGKVLLSMYSDDSLIKLLNAVELVPQTEKSVTDKAALMKQLQEIREQGYCFEINEIEVGKGAISVPVSNYCCPLALTVPGTKSWLTSNFKKIINLLFNTSKMISIELKTTLN